MRTHKDPFYFSIADYRTRIHIKNAAAAASASALHAAGQRVTVCALISAYARAGQEAKLLKQLDASATPWRRAA